MFFDGMASSRFKYLSSNGSTALLAFGLSTEEAVLTFCFSFGEETVSILLAFGFSTNEAVFTVGFSIDEESILSNGARERDTSLLAVPSA
eukprot:5713237-Ditylum_brightwellii.AAC.1